MTNLSLKNKILEPTLPEVKSIESEGDITTLTLFVPNSLGYFQGHFPNSPILPGVVQLHWAVLYAQKTFDLSELEVLDLEVLKFQVVIVPDIELILTLTKKANNKVLFAYHSVKGQHSSGRIVYRDQS